MELHVAENYYHTSGCCEATCSFHFKSLSGRIENEMRKCLSPIFFPEDSTQISLNWQVFWLTSLFAAFPSRKIETVAGIA